jgi:hypothetical protein
MAQSCRPLFSSSTAALGAASTRECRRSLATALGRYVLCAHLTHMVIPVVHGKIL